MLPDGRGRDRPVTEAEERARNKAVVTQFFERMNAGDLDGSFGLLADDCTWFSLSSRRFSGKEQMRAMIAHVNETVLRAPIVQAITVLTAEENRVAALTDGAAEALNGTRYDQRYHFLFEFADGLISRLWEFNDTFHAREFFSLNAEGRVPDRR
jgi:ketosteroid isomerase-like protein